MLSFPLRLEQDLQADIVSYSTVISGCVQVGQPKTRAVEDSITGTSWETGSGNFADQKGARDAFTKVTTSMKKSVFRRTMSLHVTLFLGCLCVFLLYLWVGELATSCNESNFHPAKPLHYARYR